MASLTSSTIGRKFAMALSAMFLLVFLVMHLSVNMLSLFSESAFNGASHFMGTNPVIQFLLQPILLLGIIFHFTMGVVLELKNRKARPVKYAVEATSSSTWMSRNMIWSGLVIELFLIVHLAGFWWHEISVKYLCPDEVAKANATRYFHELVEYFQNPVIVVVYIIGIVLLGLHLAHGFQSSLQSVGARHPKYKKTVDTVGKWYSIIIPLGFILVAVFHFFNITPIFN